MKKYVLILMISLIYIFIINYVSGIDFNAVKNEINAIQQNNFTNISYTIITSGAPVQASGFSDSVSIYVKRAPKFYGFIDGDGNDFTLHLFNMVPIPLTSHGVNYIYVHLLFGMLILIFILKE